MMGRPPAPPESRLATLARAAVAATLVLGTALVAAASWFGIALGETATEAAFAAVVLAAGAACLWRVREGGRERAAWIAIAATILLQGVTELLWALLYAGDPAPPYPSLADLGWLGFYPLTVVAIALMVRARSGSLEWRLWTDGLIAALGTAALGAAFVFELLAGRASGTPLQETVTLAYPLGDVLVLSLVVGVVALRRWRPDRTWALVLAGLIALVLADMASALASEGLEIAAVPWATPIYLIGALCIGTEALLPRAAAGRDEGVGRDWQELMVPGIVALLIVSLSALRYAGAEQSPVPSALAAATMLAIVARLAVSVMENKRLLEAVRTDPLTGLGNQGGLQVDLGRACRHAAEEPATLVLFDLNGFKHYNDTFGHPAGDEVLAELGARLRRALGPDGDSYRLGGDEFAALIDCAPARAEVVLRRATEALTLVGDDFRLGASWGAVSLPVEAGDPAAAMQLADRRMYAQKESRRLALAERLGPDLGEGLARAGSGEALKQRG